MHRRKKPPVRDLNQHLTCKLCKGYFVDATTIIECLHSFCRSCIVKYLEKNKYCPVCDVQVHKTKPLLNIRSDTILQDVVYKLVPKLLQNEVHRRRQFTIEHPETKPPELFDYYQHILLSDEPISITLSYQNCKESARYLRCPAAVSMTHLQKLIRAKYGLCDSHRVEILHDDDSLDPHITLMDIAYIYSWKRKAPIDFNYRIYEYAAKRTESEVQCTNNNWKEVQLRISENGEMSITGIQDEEIDNNNHKGEILTIDTKTPPTVESKVSPSVQSAPEPSKNNAAPSVGKKAATPKAAKTTAVTKTKTPKIKTGFYICPTNKNNSISETKSAAKSFFKCPKNKNNNSRSEMKSAAPSADVKVVPPGSPKTTPPRETNATTTAPSTNTIMAPPTTSVKTKSTETPTSQSSAAPSTQSTAPTSHAISTPTHAISAPTSHAILTPTSHAISTPTSHATPTPTSHVSSTPTSQSNSTPTSQACSTSAALSSQPISTPTPAPPVSNEVVSKPEKTQGTKRKAPIDDDAESTPAKKLSIENLSNNHPLKKHSQKTEDNFPKPPPQFLNRNFTTSSRPGTPITTNTKPVSKPCYMPTKPVIIIPKPSTSTIKANNEKITKPIPNLAALNTAAAMRIKNKPTTPLGYKTLRDPPKSWNSQIAKAKVSPESSTKTNDTSNKPAKFFKMRNNMPRYLGNPASGVKPMYQVHTTSPEKSSTPPPKQEIRKHSIVKIDPKTLKPISEKAPETSSLSSPPPVAPPTNDLKINTSSVSIFNPLKLNSSKNDRKSPHSPKKMAALSPTPAKREKPSLNNFTPSNPFVPNLASPTINPNQFLFPGAPPPGFPPYDPSLMVAYHRLFCGPQRVGFPPLGLNQRKGFELSGASQQALAQSMQAGMQHSPRQKSSPSEQQGTSRGGGATSEPTFKPPPSSSMASPNRKTSKDNGKNEKSLEKAVEKLTHANQNKSESSDNNAKSQSSDSNESRQIIDEGRKIAEETTSVKKDGAKEAEKVTEIAEKEEAKPEAEIATAAKTIENGDVTKDDKTEMAADNDKKVPDDDK